MLSWLSWALATARSAWICATDSLAVDDPVLGAVDLVLARHHDLVVARECVRGKRQRDNGDGTERRCLAPGLLVTRVLVSHPSWVRPPFPGGRLRRTALDRNWV